MPGRDIDGDALELASGKRRCQSANVRHACLEHPAAERFDQPQLFGHGNEFVGRHWLAVALPANQRLEADAHPGRERDDRLVVDLEGVGLDRVAQIAFEAEPIDRARVHVGVEQLVPRAASRLGVIHRRIGIAHHLFGIDVLHPAEGNADARRREHFASADRKWRAERD